jgi:hypothetical protein
MLAIDLNVAVVDGVFGFALGLVVVTGLVENNHPIENGPVEPTDQEKAEINREHRDSGGDQPPQCSTHTSGRAGGRG